MKYDAKRSYFEPADHGNKSFCQFGELIGVKPETVFAPGKERNRVRARSLLCYWAVRELGMSMTNLSKLLNMSVSAVSAAVERGEKLAVANNYRLTDILNV